MIKKIQARQKKKNIILVNLKTDADTMWLSMSQVNDNMIFIPVAVVSVLNIQNYSMFFYFCRAAVNNLFELIGEKYFCTPL